MARSSSAVENYRSGLTDQTEKRESLVNDLDGAMDTLTKMYEKELASAGTDEDKLEAHKKFLNNVNDYVLKQQEYITFLDDQIGTLQSDGIRLDEQIQDLLTKMDDLDADALNTEIESILKDYDSDVQTVLTYISSETAKVKNSVTSTVDAQNSSVVKSTVNKPSVAKIEASSTNSVDEKVVKTDLDLELETKDKTADEVKESFEDIKEDFEALKTDGAGLMVGFEDWLKQQKKSAGDKETKKAYREAYRRMRYESPDDFNYQMDLLQKALEAGDASAAADPYDNINAMMSRMTQTMQNLEAALGDDISYDRGGKTNMIDQWNTITLGLDAGLEFEQTGLDPKKTYETVSEGNYSYLGENVDWKDLKKQFNLTDRYKGTKQRMYKKAIFDFLDGETNDIDMKDIKGLNWTDNERGMPYVINEFLVKKAAGESFSGDFDKDTFESTFPKYDKKGLFNERRKVRKFVQKMETNKDLRDELATISDAVDERDINYSDLANAENMLNSGLITKDNIFDFLCDFDSDGTISGGEQEKGLGYNRVDSGSVMGNQVRMIMLMNANTEVVDGRMKIKEGDKTDEMILAMMQKIVTYSEDDALIQAAKDQITDIEGLITANEGKDDADKTHYSLDTFLKFAKDNPAFKGFVIDISKTQGVKAFDTYAELADQAELAINGTQSLDEVYYDKLDAIWGSGTFKEVQAKMDEETLKNVRVGFANRVMQIANIIGNIVTDHGVPEDVRKSIAGSLGLNKAFPNLDNIQKDYQAYLTTFFDKLNVNLEADVIDLLEGAGEEEALNHILENVGFWVGGSNTSLDFGDRMGAHAGLKFDIVAGVPWPRINIGGEYYFQTPKNRAELTNLGNLDAKSVNRLGISGSLSIFTADVIKNPASLLALDSKTDLILGVGWEKDHIAGILQQEQNRNFVSNSLFGLTGDRISGYEFNNADQLSTLKNVTGTTIDEKATYAETALGSYFDTVIDGISNKGAQIEDRLTDLRASRTDLMAKIGQAEIKMKSADKDEKDIFKASISKMEEQLKILDNEIENVEMLPDLFTNNQNMLKNIQSEVSKELSQYIANTDDWNEWTWEEQQTAIRSYMVSYMQGFNKVIKMRQQEALSQGVKFGGAKIQFSLKQTINMMAGNPGAILNVLSMGTLKSYRMSYTEDAAVKGVNYDKINRMDRKSKEDFETITDVKDYLAEELKMLDLTGDDGIDVQVLGDGQIKITGKNLHKLNIWHTDEAKDNYSYDGESLIIGDVGKLGVATDIGRDGAEVHLFLGNDRADNTVLLSGQNLNDKLGNIEFGKRSAELGQAGVDNLVADAESFVFNGAGSDMSTVEQGFVRDAMKKFIEDNRAAFESSIKGNMKVGIKSGVNEVTSMDDVEITFTPDTNADVYDMTNNKVTIDFAWTKTIDVKEEDIVPIDGNVQFENLVSQEIYDFRGYIRDLDTKNAALFAQFEEYMNEAALMINDDPGEVVDKVDYDKAYAILMQMVKPEDHAFHKYLVENKDNPRKVRLVVNEVKGIFATNVNLRNPSKYKSWLDSRNTTTNSWRDLKWPDGSVVNISDGYLDYKDQIKAEIDAAGYSEVPHDDIAKGLFGYTAFYRGKTTAKKYSMTAIGATRVLGNSVQELSDEHKKEMFDDGPFFDNLEKHTDDMQDIVDQMNKDIAAKVPGWDNLDNDTVLDLLKNDGKELKVTVDGVEKIFTIDIKYVFYLLGECGNESFGIQLGDRSLKDIPGERQIDITGTADESATTDGADLTAGSLLTGSEYLGGLATDEVSVQAQLQFKRRTPPEEPLIPDDSDTPEDELPPEEEIIPDDTDNTGEGEGEDDEGQGSDDNNDNSGGRGDGQGSDDDGGSNGSGDDGEGQGSDENDNTSGGRG